jgi:hypothetical protein
LPTAGVRISERTCRTTGWRGGLILRAATAPTLSSASKRTVNSATIPDFLFSLLTLSFVTAFILLPLLPLHDLVLPIATMIHSGADRCITE